MWIASYSQLHAGHSQLMHTMQIYAIFLFRRSFVIQKSKFSMELLWNCIYMSSTNIEVCKNWRGHSDLHLKKRQTRLAFALFASLFAFLKKDKANYILTQQCYAPLLLHAKEYCYRTLLVKRNFKQTAWSQSEWITENSLQFLVHNFIRLYLTYSLCHSLE